jgi:ComF family protein
MLLKGTGYQAEHISPDPLYCKNCGEQTQLLIPASTRCLFCELAALDFEIRSLWRYTPQLEQLIKQLKYQGRFQLAPYLGKQMAEAVIATGWLPGAFSHSKWDLIVPIPSSPERVRLRGFSHTALMALAVATVLKSQFSYNALKSIGRREPQASLPLERRAENVHGRFNATPSAVSSASILVIDDLLTTGSTVTEAVRTLRKAGAKDVAVLTLARTFRFQELRVLARRRRKDG